MDVDLRLLRYFVAVADELNFTRAAETLYVSQPALSKQIRQLEALLRVPLFQRSSQEVQLTAAGAALLPAARALIRDWQTAARLARTAAAESARVLRVGFVASGAGPLTTRARTVFAERHPDVTVEPHRHDWGGEVQALREGLVDVAFVWLPADSGGLHLEVVATEPRFVGLALGHRLADRDSVNIAELRDEPLMWTRRAPRYWVDWWAVNPRPDGSEPLWGPENDNVEEMLEDVAAGAGVCISPLSMALYYARPDIVWRPVTDIEPLRIALCWLRGNDSALVGAFAAVVRELLDTSSS